MNEYFIRELKSKITLSDLLSRYIKVTKKGGNHLALCPFHGEKTPSFNIDNNRGAYHCFGCNASGDAISFMQEHLSMTFPDALKELCLYAGVEMPQQTVQSAERTAAIKKSLDILEHAMEFMRKNLQNNANAMRYLKSRSISQETIADFKIGFGGVEKSSLFKELQKGFSESEIEKSGLCIKTNYGMLDRFHNRIIFPILSHSGAVIGFSGRIFNGEKDTAKYVNSPETELFKKSQVLYNFHNARKSKEKFAIVCEGFMDVIAFHKDGITNAVAQMGTAFTREHLLALSSRFEEISFCLDSDNAGILSQKRVIEMLFEIVNAEKVFSFLALVGEKDPDEFFLKNGTGSLKSSVEKRILLHEHAWHLWTNGIDFQNPMEMVKLDGHITAILGKNPVPSVQKHYDHFFKNKIYQSKFIKKQKKTIAVHTQNEKFPRNEATALAFLYQNFNTVQEAADDLEMKFKTPEIRELVERIFAGEDLSEDKNMEEILSQSLVPELEPAQIPYYHKLLYNSLLLDDIDEELIQNRQNFEKIVFLHKEKQKILKEMEEIKAFLFPQ